MKSEQRFFFVFFFLKRSFAACSLLAKQKMREQETSKTNLHSPRLMKAKEAKATGYGGGEEEKEIVLARDGGDDRSDDESDDEREKM